MGRPPGAAAIYYLRPSASSGGCLLPPVVLFSVSAGPRRSLFLACLGRLSCCSFFNTVFALFVFCGYILKPRYCVGKRDDEKRKEPRVDLQTVCHSFAIRATLDNSLDSRSSIHPRKGGDDRAEKYSRRAQVRSEVRTRYIGGRKIHRSSIVEQFVTTIVNRKSCLGTLLEQLEQSFLSELRTPQNSELRKLLRTSYGRKTKNTGVGRNTTETLKTED